MRNWVYDKTCIPVALCLLSFGTCTGDATTEDMDTEEPDPSTTEDPSILVRTPLFKNVAEFSFQISASIA